MNTRKNAKRLYPKSFKSTTYKSLFFFFLLSAVLPCCTVMDLALNFKSAKSDLISGRYEQAIPKCEECLRNNKGPKPITVKVGGIRVNADYFSTICLGGAYQMLGNYDKSTYYWLESIRIFPQKAYYSYLYLAELNYSFGKLDKAYEYSRQALDSVNSPSYDLTMKKSIYDKDLWKNAAIAASEFYRMRLDATEMESDFEMANYTNSEILAKKILNTKYHVHFGMQTAGTIVESVSKGSMADLNGFIRNDKLLKMNGVKVSTELELLHEINKLMYMYGSTVTYQIERNGRVIDIRVNLTYPEIASASTILKESKSRMKSIDYARHKKDKQPPLIHVLKPNTVRGIKVVAQGVIDFEILTSDDVGVKTVMVNNKQCTLQNANPIEQKILPGKVGKYTASFPKQGKRQSYIITAVDVNGNISQKTIEVESTNSATNYSEPIYEHKIAVVIGINKYNPWPGLEYAVNDAKAVRGSLVRMGYDKVIEIYDRDATRLRITRVLGDELLGILGPNDCLLVYFAGHGATEMSKNGEQEGYIVPADADTANFEGTAISMSYIHNMIKRYRAKHILFVFDSCYSGLGLKRGGGQKKSDEFVQNMATKMVRMIITAGGKDEQAAETKGHGVFTKSFLDVLDGEAQLSRDHFILASDVGQYIREQVGKKTNFSQTPQYGWLDGEGDYIFEVN